MAAPIHLEIQPQPDDVTCGPTCLHAVYGYYGLQVPLPQLIGEVDMLEAGGTLAVMLARHALASGFEADIYTFNLQIFDPTWFADGAPDMVERLETQARAKTDPRLRLATPAYVDYLQAGGRLHFRDLNPALLRGFLGEGKPVLTGLSATYLYRCAREVEDGPRLRYDDVRGRPQGHFVVLCGYDRTRRTVLVADPLLPNPVSPTHQYEVRIDRLIGAILLGILTYDANVLVITPRPGEVQSDAAPDRRRQP
jgi:hypothetical protein